MTEYNKKIIIKKEKNIIDLYMTNKSPLRYPGGKTRACKILDEILCKYLEIDNFVSIVSPFFGGGSFEFYIQNKYNLSIIANDKFTPLYNFWNICKYNKNELCNKLYEMVNNISKDVFLEYRKKILDDKNDLNQAFMYFVINRCSFSGSTLSGGFSSESSKKRFTKSSINRINHMELTNLTIDNLNFEEFISKNVNKNNLMFLDLPYYLEKKSK